MKRTWIKNARIVNEGQTFEGSLVIEGEMIAEILKADETPASPCEETIDAQGCYLLPGVIDDHVHFRSRLDPQGRYAYRKYGSSCRWCNQLHGHAEYQSANHHFGSIGK